MKLLLLTALAAGLLLAGVTAATPTATARGKLVHLVSFKFKDAEDKAGIRKVEEAFAALPGKIPQIASFEWGTNVSPEKHDKGFTHAFILTFRTEKERDEYLVHPAHQEFGKLVGPVLADVFVVDFLAQP